MAQARRTGFRRPVGATACSFARLRAAWHHEAAFRQECWLLTGLSPVAFTIARTPTEWGLLIATAGLVIIVELLNSAVEATIDRMGTDAHRLASRAKDLESAAVMIRLALLAVVWTLVGWEQLVDAAAALSRLAGQLRPHP
ncbi:MAG: diacylglycerol kinase [Rhodospirillaceae bacterium]|nr:diacylglycerol kinase [Rhodospirillaceae bacterium]